MSGKSGKNERNAGKPPAKPQQQKKDVKADNEKAYKPPKPVGAISELDVFDYTNYRIDARAFNQAKIKLLDYAAIHYDRAAQIIEFTEEYDFSREEPQPAVLAATATEAQTKLAQERYMKAWVEHDRRMQHYNDNKVKLYGVIWGQCTTAMRHKIMESDDYDEMTRRKNVLALWKEVKRLSLEDRGPNNQNPFKRVEEANAAFNRVRQYNGEKLGDFYDRFLTEVEAAESCGVEFRNQEQYSQLFQDLQDEELSRKRRAAARSASARTERKEPDEPVAPSGNTSSSTSSSATAAPAINLTRDEQLELSDRAKQTVRDQQLAIIFLNKLDKKKYGAMLEDWDNRLNDGEDVYPKTLNEAFRRVSNRKMDPRNMHVAGQGVAFVAQESGKPSTGNGSGPGKSPPPNKTRPPQHQQSTANAAKEHKPSGSVSSTNSTPNATDDKCWFCGLVGHRKYDCEEFKRAWIALKKQGKAHLTLADDEVGFCITSTEVMEWELDDPSAELQDRSYVSTSDLVFYSKEVIKNASTLHPFDILCDNQATVSVFHQLGLITNVRKAQRPINLSGIGGSILVDQVGDFGQFGQVYYHPRALANILCFHDLASKYHVSYDSSKVDAFVVTTPKRVVTFKSKGKLYVYNPRHDKTDDNDNEMALVQTVEGNKLPYTKREIADAEGARDEMSRPALKDFKIAVRDGHVLNCPYTVADVNRAEEIFGKDLGAIRGRTVRETPKAVRIDTSSVFKHENKKVILAVDLAFIEQIPFLVTISRGLGLMTVHVAQ